MDPVYFQMCLFSVIHKKSGKIPAPTQAKNVTSSSGPIRVLDEDDATPYADEVIAGPHVGWGVRAMPRTRAFIIGAFTLACGGSPSATGDIKGIPIAQLSAEPAATWVREASSRVRTKSAAPLRHPGRRRYRRRC
jgi:hypothetical protein